MMTKPPAESLGYRASSATIVDSYMSRSSRIQGKGSGVEFGQSVREEALDENHLIVKKAITPEVLFDGFQRHFEVIDLVVSSSVIGGELGGVRRGQSLKGIANINSAANFAKGSKNAAHQNATAAAPELSLDVVAGHAFIDGPLYEVPQVLESRLAGHAVRQHRPVRRRAGSNPSFPGMTDGSP